MGKKLTQVSFLFVFATLLVVIGHADITLDYRDLWIYKWVYSFHMPLFFFCMDSCLRIHIQQIKCKE